MRLGRMAAGLVAATACLAAAAAMANRPNGGNGGDLGEAILTAASPAEAEGPIRITAVQVFFPGVPERFACRMQLTVANEGDRVISLRTLLTTRDGDNQLVNSWLVPSGILAPGEAVERIYSCKQADRLTVSRESPHGWPTVCVVGGEEVSPCPVALRISTSLRLAGAD
jgi:hypothetical protein